MRLAGLVLGLVMGWAVTASAQALSEKIDPANAVCWDQPATSLAAANAIRVRVTYDAGTATAATQTCAGAASPFTCNLTTPIPMAVQTVGTHTVKVEGASVNPDGSLSAYTVLVSGSVTFWNAAPPPSAGSNFRIIKLLQALTRAFQSFWAWLT